MKLRLVEVRGAKYEVHVDEHSGQFSAHPSGDATGRVYADNYAALLETIEKAEAKMKVRVAVPFSVEGKNGVVTGIHVGTGKLLVAWEDGTKEQRSIYKASRALTPEEGGARKALVAAREAANAALRSFDASIPESLLEQKVEAEIEKAREKNKAVAPAEPAPAAK